MMLSDKALKMVSDFVLRKVPEGMFGVRTFCACYRRLDIKNLDELVNILNEVFEKFGNLVEDWEVKALEPWLRPYGIVIERGERYRARIVRSGYEEKIEEIFDYYSCGMKKGALVLAKAILDLVARDKGYKDFKELPQGNLNYILNEFYEMLEKDLSDEETIFVLKTVKNVIELCSSLQV